MRCVLSLLGFAEVDVLGEHGDHGGHLLHAGAVGLVGVGLEVVRHSLVDERHHVQQLHALVRVPLQHLAQRLDEPRAVVVVAPRKVTCGNRRGKVL